MNIKLHFPKGSTSIIDGTYTGYEYSRSDKLINAHITFDESYKLFINQHRLVLSYKYITVNHQHSYTIGRWVYDWNTIDNYKGSEGVHLVYLQCLTQELIEDESLNGRPIDNYRIALLINQFREEK